MGQKFLAACVWLTGVWASLTLAVLLFAGATAALAEERPVGPEARPALEQFLPHLFELCRFIVEERGERGILMPLPMGGYLDLLCTNQPKAVRT